MKNKCDLSGLSCKAVSLVVLFAAIGIAAAQNVVVTSATGKVTLASNPAMVTFVPSKASSAAGAAKDAVLSGAQGQAVAATLARAVPIPIIGPFAGPLMGTVMAKLHPPKAVGFSIAFVQGLSAKTAVPQGDTSFRVPTNALQGATPVLLRITPSVKDSTRIVRSLQLSVKVTGSSLTPSPENTKLLSVEESAISCRKEAQDGDTVLIPESPLEVGEYAVAAIPATKDNMAPVGLVWDFRIAEHAAAKVEAAPAATTPAAATETQTISKGQSQSQIVAALGKPERIAKLGVKEVYYYKEMKVVFVNNKVVDIQ